MEGHFMIKEIKDEPDVFKKVLDYDVIRVSRIVDEFDRLFLVGCGTSYFISQFGEFVLREARSEKTIRALPSSELNYEVERLDEGTLVIASSRSGETTETCLSAKKAKDSGAHLIALTNEMESKLAKMADEVIPMQCGEENAVIMTKTFSSACLNLLKISKVIRGETISERFPEVVHRLIESYEDDVKKLSRRVASSNFVFVLSHREGYPIAREGSLKMMEGAIVPTAPFHILEFRHGPKALLSKDTTVIAILSEDDMFGENVKVLEECVKKGSNVVLITNSREEVDGVNKFFINLDDPSEFSVAAITPIQMLSYYTALEKGLNPDKPKNLTKVVIILNMSSEEGEKDE
ncbi:MAG: SIS domain-containing protein [Candidatus Asgardarchaeia archaeon]